MPRADQRSLRQILRLMLAGLLIAPELCFADDAAGAGEPGTDSVALDPAESDTARELLRRVAAATGEKLRSGSGVGMFRRYVQPDGQEQPHLRTEARVEIHFDGDKCRVRFDLLRNLIPTTSVDMHGNETTRLADWKYDDVYLVDDSDAVYVVKFSKRIRPAGCSGEIFAKRSIAHASAIGVSWGNPAEYWKWKGSLNLDSLLSNLRPDEVRLERTAAGDYRGNYAIRNSPKNRVEFRTSTGSGHRIVESRIFNTDDETRTSTAKLTWKEVDGTWFVNSYEDEHTIRHSGRRERIREEFEFESFSPNAAVDGELLKIASLPIPGNTRFLDRRR